MANDRIISPADMKKQFEFIEKIKNYNTIYSDATNKQKGAFVLTFGCQQNEADSEKIMGMLLSMGYRKVDEPKDADIIVVNTCAIREHAELKALSIVGQYKHLKAKNPELIIAVCGCMVTQEHRKNDIKFKYPYVDFILDTSSIHKLPEVLLQKIELKKRIFLKPEEEYMVAEGLPIERESKYKAWVSIMYGCNNFCTYCIVPYVRGRERSRRKEDIIAEVKDLVQKGYKDITLLGQNVNSYGKDSNFDYDFADLLLEIDKIDGDYLLHFMTSHPKDATEKLIDVMSKSKHIARQFHLPIQSGSDRILKAMNRHYDKEKYLKTVAYIKEKMPDVVLSTDIIVGFPTETEEDFEETISIIKSVRYDMIYSFIYSKRKGTPASTMDGQIPEKEKSVRFQKLLDVQNEIGYEINQKYLGKTIKVLCDGYSKNNDKVLSGRTEGNKIVLFDGNGDNEGKYLNIKITKADTFALYGEII